MLKARNLDVPMIDFDYKKVDASIDRIRQVISTCTE